MAKRGRKLSNKKTIRVRWKDYVRIREKAMDEDKTIPECAHELLSGTSENLREKSPEKSREKFSCSECGKEFDTKKQLQGHMLHHKREESDFEEEQSSEEDQKFECKNCGREFDTKRGLSLHKNYCGKSASQKPGGKK